MSECLNIAEGWREVPGTEGRYSVSSLGRVRSDWQGGGILAVHAGRKGYLQVRLSLRCGRPTFRVHRLVAAAFIGPRPVGMQVDHKDGNKINNRPENLEYVTCRENIRRCWKAGLHGVEHCRGEANNKAKLTEEDVRTIRAIYPARSLAELARTYGVTVANVSSVVRRKTWKHA